jgi:hypothetical protein
MSDASLPIEGCHGGSSLVAEARELTFARPIVIRDARFGSGRSELRTVAEGIEFLSLFEESSYEVDASAQRTAWAEALYQLWGAKFDRTPQSIEGAHRALHRLISACGLLGTNGALPATVQDHLGQQLRAAYGQIAPKPAVLGESTAAPEFEAVLQRIENARLRRVQDACVGAVAAALDGAGKVT